MSVSNSRRKLGIPMKSTGPMEVAVPSVVKKVTWVGRSKVPLSTVTVSVTEPAGSTAL